MKAKIYTYSMEESRMVFDLCNMTVLKDSTFENVTIGYGIIVSIKTIEERFALERVITFLLDNDKHLTFEGKEDDN